MIWELTVEERDILLQTLTEEQRHFLHHDMLRSRRTIFAQWMAREKGADIPAGAPFEDIERFLDGWIYTGYVDAGFVSPNHKCDCGRPLRYQHEVRHKVTKQVMHFGIIHLGEHLQLDAKTVAAIKKGFDVLDREMDEILIKVKNGWSFEREWTTPIPVGFVMPPDIEAHMDAQLPLLDRQLMRLQKNIMAYMQRGTYRRSAEPARPAAPFVPPPLEEAAPSLLEQLPEPEEQYGQVEMWFPDEEPAQMVPAEPEQETEALVGVQELELEYHLIHQVENLLRSGVNSARVLTEILLKDGANDQYRFSTGKPMLYVRVAMHIDNTLVPQGFCRLLSKTAEDRQYAWVG